MKARVVGLLLGLVLVGLVAAPPAKAAYTWAVCTVDATGISSSSLLVMLSSANNFSKKWFGVGKVQEKAMLAAILVAFSNNKKLYCYVDPAVEYSKIDYMYLLSGDTL